MIIKTLIAAIVLLAITHYLVKRKWDWPQLNISRRGRINLFILIGFLFLVFAYFIPTSYYFPHNNNGVTGDNYLHMHWALTRNNYFKNHHLLFPLVAEKFVKGVVDIGLLKYNDPDFPEKAFRLSVMPVKAAMILSLVTITILFYKRTKHLKNTVLLFFLFATSFSIWVWGIQSNALGLAIATEILCIAFFGLWYKMRKTWHIILLAFLTGLGMFIHNGFIYFAVGLAISFFVATIFQREISKKVRYLHFASFFGITLCMAILFYLLEARINNTYNISKLFDILSDIYYFGSFEFDRVDWLGSIESNLWSGVNWFANFDHNGIYKYWAPELVQVAYNPGLIALRIIQLGSMVTILISIVYSGIINGFKPSKELFIPGIITSILFFAGFTLRQAGTHYYTLAIVPNLALILSFAFSNKNTSKDHRIYTLLIILLISSNFIYNSFSKYAVFEGSDINDHPYYAESIIIYNSVANENVIYFRDIDISYYPNQSMAQYYGSKFGHINWIPQAGNWETQEELLRQVQTYTDKGYILFLNAKAYNLISESDALKFVKINDQIRKLK